MNNYWQFHDSKMLELKSIYKRKDKQLQNKLQDIFNRFNIEFSEIYNIVDSKTKEMADIYIEELEDNNLLTGMFGIMARNIKNRKRVKYSEILLLMIYGIYQEEQKKLDEIELKIIKEEANYYYQQGQKEVNKNRRVSNITDDLLFSLLAIPDSKGYVWDEYNEGIKKYNAEQIYRQAIINLQQGNKLDISQVEYQNIIKKQQNSKLNVNTKGDDIKISGSIDNFLIGIDNQAKIEGIKSFDENAIVKIIAVHDEKTTEMCKSLDNQYFYVHDWNEFERYSDVNRRIMKYKCFGLIIGLNCPPINDNFHYCRSIVKYVDSIEFIPKSNIASRVVEQYIKKNYNISKLKIKNIDKSIVLNNLRNLNKVYKDFPIVKNKINKIVEESYNDGTAMTIIPDGKGNYTLGLNKEVLNNKKIFKEAYEYGVKKHLNPQNSKYSDVAIHELGHCVNFEIIRKRFSDNINLIKNDWNNSITANEIVNKAFENLKINDKMKKDWYIRSISEYAWESSSETIGEAFVDYYRNKNKANKLSKEIIKIMKGMI